MQRYLTLKYWQEIFLLPLFQLDLFVCCRRKYSRPVKQEVYVCFHESTPQNVVEMAFRLNFGLLSPGWHQYRHTPLLHLLPRMPGWRLPLDSPRPVFGSPVVGHHLLRVMMSRRSLKITEDHVVLKMCWTSGCEDQKVLKIMIYQIKTN